MSAGLVPLFTSAPRIMLRINETPVAFAIGFNMNISVDVQPVQTIGKFGALSLEPTMYNVVTGTIQIIKLVSKTTTTEQAAAVAGSNSKIHGNTSWVVTQKSNGSKPQAENVKDVTAATNADSSSISQLQNLEKHIDPDRVLFSRTFDMDLYLKVPTEKINATADDNGSFFGGKETPTEEAWLRIEKCRLTSRNVNISIGQLVNEPVNFQGLLASPMQEGGTATDTQLWSLDTSVKEST